MQVNAKGKEKNIRFHAVCTQAAFKPQSPRYLIWTPFGAMTSLRHAGQTWPAERREGAPACAYKPGHNLHKQNHFSNTAPGENQILVLIYRFTEMILDAFRI